MVIFFDVPLSKSSVPKLDLPPVLGVVCEPNFSTRLSIKSISFLNSYNQSGTR